MILLELIIQFQYERQAACFKEIDALVSTGANVANWLKLPSQMSEVLTEAFSVKCYSQSFITRAFRKYKRCCWAESAAVSIREISEQERECEIEGLSAAGVFQCKQMKSVYHSAFWNITNVKRCTKSLGHISVFNVVAVYMIITFFKNLNWHYRKKLKVCINVWISVHSDVVSGWILVDCNTFWQFCQRAI